MTQDTFNMQGKVCLITGGSRGLGKAMSVAFAQQGATVIVASRKLDICQQTAAFVTEQTGQPCDAMALHVGDWDQCTATFDQIITKYGKLDVLVNNAGMSPLYGNLTDVTQALFDKVIDVNLKGPFRLMALAGEKMMASENGGNILNISSISGVQPSIREVVYGAAKAGLNSMTLALAHAYGPKVRVNGIMPGAFLTDISNAWDMDAFKQNAKNNIPLQRGGEPHEIIGAALFLCSDAGSYTTGTIVKVDGGAAWSAM